MCPPVLHYILLLNFLLFLLLLALFKLFDKLNVIVGWVCVILVREVGNT